MGHCVGVEVHDGLRDRLLLLHDIGHHPLHSKQAGFSLSLYSIHSTNCEEDMDCMRWAVCGGGVNV